MSEDMLVKVSRKKTVETEYPVDCVFEIYSATERGYTIGAILIASPDAKTYNYVADAKTIEKFLFSSIPGATYQELRNLLIKKYGSDLE